MITSLIHFLQTNLMIMKSYFWLIVLILFLTVTSCEKENDSGQLIYSNSFESQSDTAGWKGYAFSFSNDVPKHGGKRSLSVSGGCIVPHAQYTISPQNTDSYLIFKLWGKNLNNGGGVFLDVNKAGCGSVAFNVSEKDWTLYESQDTLFCPANTSLTLGAFAGGITYSAILIDMVEIRKLNVSP
jgi:hypothetical protein